MNVIPVVSINKISKTAISEALGKDRVEFLDWDKFFYIKRKEGRPVQDPEWPSNFIKAVRCLVYETEGLEAYKNLRYVFINAGPKPLKYLIESKIPFVIVMPRIFGGKYMPVDHYQWLNKEYLELDMPMIYLNDDEYLNVFKRNSTYRYLIDKIDFVEGYRFGTCIFAEDLDEFDEIFEDHNSIIGCAEVDSSVTESIIDVSTNDTLKEIDTISAYIVKNKSGKVLDHFDNISNCFTTLKEILKENPNEEYTIFDPAGEVVCIAYYGDDDLILKQEY